MSLALLAEKIERRIEGYEDLGLSVFLAVLCLLSFVLFPFLDIDEGPARKFIPVAYTLLFVAGAFIGGLRGWWRRLAILLALLSVTSAWVAEATHGDIWRLINLAASVVFMLMLSAALTRQVLRPGEINNHRIRGAVAVYLLIGFIFALLFVLIEETSPGSFSGLGDETESAHMKSAIYYSFVTLTTLGYGEILPIGEGARSLVIVEAVVGQLFLIVLIGRLVSLADATEIRRKR